jgi:hypothetical protein
MVAEIETDKTTFEVTAPVDGTLLARSSRKARGPSLRTSSSSAIRARSSMPSGRCGDVGDRCDRDVRPGVVRCPSARAL